MPRRFYRDDSGATAVEYALMVALIAVAIIGAATAFSTSVGDSMTGSTGQIVSAFNGS
jgi:pilus assembly protein Flp/PilA